MVNQYYSVCVPKGCYLKPKSVIRYNVNGLLHKNTILYNVIFLMTVIRKYAIQFVDYLLLTTCILYFSSTNDRFGIKDIQGQRRAEEA